MDKKVTGLLALILLVLVGGLFAYPEYKEYRAKEDAGKPDAGRSESEDRNRVVIPFGQEGRLATLAVTVHGFEEADSISGVLFGTTEAKEDSKFILVDATFVNITNETFTLYPEDIYIADRNGVTYDIYDSTSGGAIGSEERAIDGRDLGNSIKERGMIVYEVAKDFEPYALEIEKWETEDTLVFELR